MKIFVQQKESSIFIFKQVFDVKNSKQVFKQLQDESVLHTTKSFTSGSTFCTPYILYSSVDLIHFFILTKTLKVITIQSHCCPTELPACLFPKSTYRRLNKSGHTIFIHTQIAPFCIAINEVSKQARTLHCSTYLPTFLHQENSVKLQVTPFVHTFQLRIPKSQILVVLLTTLSLGTVFPGSRPASTVQEQTEKLNVETLQKYLPQIAIDNKITDKIFEFYVPHYLAIHVRNPQLRLITMHASVYTPFCRPASN